jgi:hypothetical protein
MSLFISAFEIANAVFSRGLCGGYLHLLTGSRECNAVEPAAVVSAWFVLDDEDDDRGNDDSAARAFGFGFVVTFVMTTAAADDDAADDDDGFFFFLLCRNLLIFRFVGFGAVPTAILIERLSMLRAVAASKSLRILS